MSIWYIEKEVENIAKKIYMTLQHVSKIVITRISLHDLYITHGYDFDMTKARKTYI